MNTQRITSYLRVFLMLVTLSVAQSALADMLPADSILLTTISSFLAPGQKAIIINVNKGNVAFKGTIDSDEFAASLIARTYALKAVNTIDVSQLQLPNKSPISLNAKVIGFTQGSWLREGFFGSGVTLPSGLPVRITISNWIVFLDGTVDNRYILSRTIINAQLVAQRIPPTPMRVLSRMMIRVIQVRTR